MAVNRCPANDFAGQVIDLAVVRDFLDSERLVIAVDDLPMSEVNEPVYRIILSRYHKVDLFERVSNLEALGSAVCGGVLNQSQVT